MRACKTLLRPLGTASAAAAGVVSGDSLVSFITGSCSSMGLLSSLLTVTSLPDDGDDDSSDEEGGGGGGEESSSDDPPRTAIIASCSWRAILANCDVCIIILLFPFLYDEIKNDVELFILEHDMMNASNNNGIDVIFTF